MDQEQEPVGGNMPSPGQAGNSNPAFGEYHGWPNVMTWVTYSILTDFDAPREYFRRLVEQGGSEREVEVQVTEALRRWREGRFLRQALRETAYQIATQVIQDATGYAEWVRIVRALEAGDPLEGADPFTSHILQALRSMDWRSVIGQPPPSVGTGGDGTVSPAGGAAHSLLQNFVRSLLLTWADMRKARRRGEMHIEALGYQLIDDWLALVRWERVWKALNGA